MLSLTEQIKSSIKRRRLLSPGDRILVAVSGGVDSMVLLRVLFELASEEGWRLTVAHYNHQLRGRSSAADEQLVRRTANELNLPVVVGRGNVKAFAARRGVSIEMAGRDLRHQFLARIASTKKLRRVALAHHLDDQIELFFLRLFRGTGTHGLGGMTWSSPSPSNSSITLVRPLLDRPKKDLVQFASQKGVRYREDATNALLDFDRNRIRHELLPLLESTYRPGLRPTIFRLMEMLGAESSFLDTVAEVWLKANPAASKNKQVLGRGPAPGSKRLVPAEKFDATKLLHTAFEALPVAIQRRCLRVQLAALGASADYNLIEHLRLEPEVPIEFNSARLGGASELVSGEDGRLSGRRLVREPSGVVRLLNPQTTSFKAGVRKLNLNGTAGSLEWDGFKVTWNERLGRSGLKPEKQANVEMFDADAIGNKVLLRHWRPGDRFQPIGMSQSVKLQDLFVNQKVPREERTRRILATTGRGEVFWVEGLRISERFKLTTSTIRRLHWRWQRL